MSSRGTALVTGASSGIGEAFARLLADEGFDLVITARREDRLRQLAAELPGDVEVLVADLSRREDVDGLLEALSGKRIHLLVNNAAADFEEHFPEASWDDVGDLLDINVRALTRLTHFFTGKMIEAGGGRIVNLASMAAFHPVPGMDVYAASKAFVLSLSESLSESLKGTGVSVTALCPGLTATRMARTSILDQVPPQLVSDPASIARAGLTAVMNREVICIPGPAGRLALAWAQHQPRWLVRSLGGIAGRIARASVKRSDPPVRIRKPDPTNEEESHG